MVKLQLHHPTDVRDNNNKTADLSDRDITVVELPYYFTSTIYWFVQLIWLCLHNSLPDLRCCNMWAHAELKVFSNHKVKLFRHVTDITWTLVTVLSPSTTFLSHFKGQPLLYISVNSWFGSCRLQWKGLPASRCSAKHRNHFPRTTNHDVNYFGVT